MLSNIVRRTALALLALAALSCVAAQNKSIRVGYLATVGFSPLNIAEGEGYWKSVGVQVQLVPFEDTKAEVKALTDGDIDIAGGIIGDFVGWQMNGAPIKLTAETHWLNGSAKIVLQPGVDAGHLAGKTIGLGYNEQGLAFFLGRYLNANGMRYTDVKIQEGSASQLLAAFKKGQLAGVVLTDADANLALQNGTIGVDSASYEKLVMEGFAASSNSLANIPEDQWIRFYKGWLKSVSWIRGNGFSWAGYRKLLDPVVYSKMLAEGNAAAMDNFNGVRFPSMSDLTKWHGPLGEMEYHVRAVLRFMQETGQIKTEPEARPLIQSKAFERALKEAK